MSAASDRQHRRERQRRAQARNARRRAAARGRLEQRAEQAGVELPTADELKRLAAGRELPRRDDS